MFEQPIATTEAREIYKINNILRNYKINFYYSLRKDAIFLFEGRSVKYRIITAYILTALGSISFLLTALFPDIFFSSAALYFIYPLAALSCFSGMYIFRDLYLKIKYNKTKTMITRNGISFRDKNQFEYWDQSKIKNMEVVQTISQKAGMKPGFNEKKLQKTAKILVYNHIGVTKTLLEINHPDRQIGKSDLEEIAEFISRFYSSQKESINKTVSLKNTQKSVYQN